MSLPERAVSVDPALRLGEAMGREPAVAHATDLGRGQDTRTLEEWSLSVNGETKIALPRLALLRAIMFNHLYHHRGQLLVYLRLLGEPVPAVYGMSADENPFM